MFFVLSKIVNFLVSPLVWVIMLLLAGWFLRKPKMRKFCFVAGVILLLFFSNRYLARKALGVWEMPAGKLCEVEQTYDYAIVLGGFSKVSDELNQLVFQAEADRLMRLWSCITVEK